MRRKNIFKLGIFFLVTTLFLISFSSAYIQSTVQYVASGALPGGFSSSGGQWIPDRTACEAGQDFVVQIDPFGCEPAIVRSDLLEEQNSPVLCKLSATKMNPLIGVGVIDSISFSGKQLPSAVSGVGFYPAQSALGVKDKLNSPLLNNIGYAVIVLKKQPNASAMPEYVSGNLTATLRYNIKDAFGIGDTKFYLPEVGDETVWDKTKSSYSFWNGRGFLRAESIGETDARISVYSGTGQKLKTISLDKGETSSEIYLPGFDCFVGAKLTLDNLELPNKRAVLSVNGDTIQLNQGEKFLDNKCTLSKIDKRGLTKKVEINCKEDEGSKSFELVLTPKVSLTVGGVKGEYSTGDRLYEGILERKKTLIREASTEKVVVYLGYIGTKGDSGKLDDLYITLVATPVDSGAKLTEADIAKYADRSEGLYSNIYRDQSKTVSALGYVGNLIEDGFLTALDSTSRNIYLKYVSRQPGLLEKKTVDLLFAGKKVEVNDFASPVNSAFKEGGASSRYYVDASADYSKIITSFGGEKYPASSIIPLGEEAFVRHLKLAGLLQQKGDIGTLCTNFKKAYPARFDLEGDIKLLCDSLYRSSSTSSSREVLITGKQKIIYLQDVREPSFEEYGVSLKVTDNSKKQVYYLDLIRDKTTYIPESTQYAQLVAINKDTISMNINRTTDSLRALYETAKVDLTKGTPNSFGTAYTFEIVNIYQKNNARVSVVPVINRAQTEANFSFYIGIEKRSIELSPEKTKQKIIDLNKTISDWKSKSESLGKVVEGMKGACLATGLALTMKNFIANVDGQSIARNEVMNGEGGWNKKCMDAVATKRLDGKSVTYTNVQQCFIGESAKIDKDVSTLYQIIKNQDSEIKPLQDNCKVKDQGGFTGVLLDTVIDTECLKKAYSPSIKSELATSLKDYQVKGVDNQEILTLIGNNKVSIEDMRKLQLYTRANAAGVSDLSKKELDKLLLEISNSNKQEITLTKAAEGEGVSLDKFRHLSSGKTAAQTFSYAGLKYVDISSNRNLCSLDKICDEGTSEGTCYTDCDRIGITAKTSVQYFTLDNGKEYVATLDSQGTKLFMKSVYDLSSGSPVLLSDKEKEAIASKFNFEVMNEESYTGNTYKSSSGSSIPGPILRCYDTTPYKNYPAIAPVDTTNGWYAQITQNIPVAGAVASYQDSGRVSTFYLCNVWKDGIESNGGGDDKCTMINLLTGQPLTQISGLTSSQASNLVSDAVKVIEAGQKRCQLGATTETFSLGTKAKGVRMGPPAANVPDLQCYNFMSPSDCKLLFNVCDPVICPSSRCNFGGKYPVKDVIASGIAGSVLLCLPNFIGTGGDVYIPVCLSGIKAGIDGLLSVFESYRDCLQENLATGQMTGICDEIYSVHLCEFFWRQALPLTQMIVPKTIELIMGQSVRGGGEYANVQNAWSTAGQSMDYFAQYYAAEAYTSFKSKVTQGVTDAVCKTYISASYPDGGKILDSLTKANSPPQYTGRFDEIAYTTATNPPISQYKVFYHIYAGNDSRVYYQVYLTDAETSSYYKDTDTKLVVSTGYIEQGGKKTETKDFTAVAGYKKMCIIINGKEPDCGFKQVSSSFAIDYIADQYTISQANETGITSESDCVSGTASAWSLASINLEGAADEIVSPKLYNRGIIRICASENPGTTTDANALNPRWISVGYCGKKELKCWLDKESVKSAVKFNSSTDFLANATTNFLEQIIKEGKYLDDNQFSTAVTELEGKDPAVVISTVNNLLGKVLMNAQKGKLYLLRADAYGKLADAEFAKEQEEAKAAAEAAAKEKEKVENKEVYPVGNNICTPNNATIDYLFKAINKKGGFDMSFTYSRIDANKVFVDGLYENKVISKEEYDYIRGGVNKYTPGFLLNFYKVLGGSTFGAGEENMQFVFNLIEPRYYAMCADLKKKAGTAGVENKCGSDGLWVDVNGLCTLRSELECTDEGFKELLTTLKSTSVGDRKCLCGDNCEAYAEKITEASDIYSIDRRLFLSLIMEENNCEQIGESSAHAFGATQIIEKTFNEVCKGKIAGLDSFENIKGESNLNNNLLCGALILKTKYNSYKNGLSVSTLKSDSCSTCCKTEPYLTKYSKYTEWDAALRGYNGWGCASGAKINYVETIDARYVKLQEMCAGVVSSSTGSPEIGGGLIESATTVNSNELLLKSTWVGDKNQYLYGIYLFSKEGRLELRSNDTQCSDIGYVFNGEASISQEDIAYLQDMDYDKTKKIFYKKILISSFLSTNKYNSNYVQFACYSNGRTIIQRVFGSSKGIFATTVGPFNMLSSAGESALCTSTRENYISAINNINSMTERQKYSKYSSTDYPNQVFVDGLFKKGLLTQVDYNDIIGNDMGTFLNYKVGSEENMVTVLEILKKRYKEACGDKSVVTLSYDKSKKSFLIKFNNIEPCDQMKYTLYYQKSSDLITENSILTETLSSISSSDKFSFSKDIEPSITSFKNFFPSGDYRIESQCISNGKSLGGLTKSDILKYVSDQGSIGCCLFKDKSGTIQLGYSRCEYTNVGQCTPDPGFYSFMENQQCTLVADCPQYGKATSQGQCSGKAEGDSCNVNEDSAIPGRCKGGECSQCVKSGGRCSSSVFGDDECCSGDCLFSVGFTYCK